jgi:FtsH-binding integral membrane protein
MRQTEIYFFFQNLALYILLGAGAIIIFVIFVAWIIKKIKSVTAKLRKRGGDGDG